MMQHASPPGLPQVDKASLPKEGPYIRAQMNCRNPSYFQMMSWQDRELNPGLEALMDLRQGNLRFAQQHTRRSLDNFRQRERSGPVAVIVCSTDSCVQPWEIFDQQQEDLVVVRLPGGCMNDQALASVLLAIEGLGARLVVVLNHSRDGICYSAVQDAARSGVYAYKGSGAAGGAELAAATAPAPVPTEWQAPYVEYIRKCKAEADSKGAGREHPMVRVLAAITPAIERVASARLAECHARGQLNGRCIPLIGCDVGTVEQVTKVHAQLSAEQLYGALREWLPNGVAREVTVKGAYYCVDSRIVTFLP